MRIAVLYDIHGNLPALEAVVAELRSEAIDLIVIGGDVVPGPMPVESLTFLAGLDIPVRCIQGNGEYEVLAARAGRETGNVPEAFRPVIRWVAEQLSEEHDARLAGWPDTLTIADEAVGDLLFCHATPRSRFEIFTRLTPESKLQDIFADVSAGIVVCGHTHMQFDRTIGGRRVINAGSVGMPFGEPGAYWLRIGPGIDLRRTDYDLEDAAARVRATAYPQAAAFASGNILKPPAESAMLDLFTKASTKDG